MGYYEAGVSDQHGQSIRPSVSSPQKAGQGQEGASYVYYRNQLCVFPESQYNLTPLQE